MSKYKLKTHSGAKKRFRSTASGRILMGQAGKRHGMRKRSAEMRRHARGTGLMASCDAKIIIKSYAPYGLK